MLNKKLFLLILLLILPLTVTMRTKDEIMVEKQGAQMVRKEHEVLLPQAMDVTEKWSTDVDEPVYSSPVIADINGDGSLEIIIGSGTFPDSILGMDPTNPDIGKVYCLNSDGNVEWSFTAGAAVFSSPAVADLEGDGSFEIIFGSNDNYTYCLNSDGTEKWKRYMAQSTRTTPCIADLDKDGTMEIITASVDWKVHCLNHTGGVEWYYCTGGFFWSSPAVADLDDDEKLEVVIGCTGDGYVCCLNHTGGLKWSYYTTLQPIVGLDFGITSSAVIADLDMIEHWK